MKGLGLAGAGLGAAAATTPVFRDLDEAVATNINVHSYPWWVNELDFDTATVEIDWNMMQPYNATEHTFNPKGSALYNDYAQAEYGETPTKWRADQATRREQYRTEGRPGYTTRDLALGAGQSGWGDFADPVQSYGFLGRQRAKTPEDYDLPGMITQWTGTPEESSRLIKAAARFFGAADISIVQLNPATTRKLIYADEFGDSKKYRWADVEVGSESATERVLPNKAQWVISTLLHQGYETTKRGIFSMRYPFGRYVQDALQEFLRGLGYNGYGPYRYTNNLSANVGLGVLGGLGELGRYNQLLTPVHHAMMGVGSSVITDLPLAPTHPVDAGMHTFCITCKKCAETCPGDALNVEDDEPLWDPLGPWNHAGYRHWWFDAGRCFPFADIESCNTAGCQKVCPFAKRADATIHEIVKGTVATTSVFNGFMRAMDDAFGYDARLQDGFWDLELPIMGIDTTIGVPGY
jgi:reductive dehalogenase